MRRKEKQRIKREKLIKLICFSVVPLHIWLVFNPHQRGFEDFKTSSPSPHPDPPPETQVVDCQRGELCLFPIHHPHPLSLAAHLH